MRLSAEGLANDRAKWEEAGYALPKFDRETVTEAYKRKSVLDPLRCGKYLPCISGKCSTEPVE